MLDGSFSQASISSIIVDRGARQRKELKNVQELADSISRLGLIHPITVTRDLVLIAGERRLEACRSLGWTAISIQYEESGDPSEARAIELEENIKRVNIEWKEECEAVLEYHENRTTEVPGWEQKDTAAALGLHETTVRERLDVAKELRSGNKLVREAPMYSTARGIVARAKERAAVKSIEAIRETIGAPVVKDESFPGSIINADFTSWITTYSGPKFNFIHCDFPYGINADKFVQGAADTHGGYDDTPDTYWHLVNTLLNNLDRICADSCHFMFWFSLRFYGDTRKAFDDRGVYLDPFPLIWTKTDNVGIIPDPERGPRRIYETALFGSRGDRKIVKPVSNWIGAPTDRGFHMSVKPVGMLSHFFRMFVDSSTIMLDPTCGSGSAIRAAEAAGASYALGLERNEEFAEKAVEALKQSRKI